MSLFAIGDLHLPGGADKPMSVFGSQWEGHFERISQAWRSMVSEEDTVLIPGDISWAMRLEDALGDLRAIGALPGKKVLIRGNHDYWWGSITRVRAALPEGMFALQQDALDLGDAVVCGTRGWIFPTEESALPPADEKICLREVGRLEMALSAAEKIAKGRPLIVMLHFPPLLASARKSVFTDLMEERGAAMCVYGHLHGAGIQAGFTGELRGVSYALTSCDSLGFTPMRIIVPAKEQSLTFCNI